MSGERAAALSRREVLRFLLGAPLASQACRRFAKRTPGVIAGSSESIGHRLRWEPGNLSSAATKRLGVVIVGAGPSGLSAAWRLTRMGYDDYVILDLETRAGGTSAYGTDGIVPYPWGAHYVPAPRADHRALGVLLREMGALEDGAGFRPKETVRIREPEERLFMGGEWHEGLFPERGATAEDLDELRRFSSEMTSWAKKRDGRGRRAFTIPLSHCSDDSDFTELDGQNAAEYLDRRGYRSRRLRWYVEYACRDDYGLSLEQTSAWAMVFYFAARVPDAGSESAPFLTWPEGNGRLVRHLASVAGPRLLLGRLVTDVIPEAEGVTLAALDARTGSLTRYVAAYAILAVPQFVARRILRPWRERPPVHVKDFSYGAWLVANLHLRKRPASVGFPFAWDNVLYDSPSLGYVVATHQTLADHGPTVWTYYRPFTSDDPRAERRSLLELEHAEIADAVLQDLDRAHRGLDEAIERVDVWRWGHAMVRPVPGFIWGPSRRQAASPVGRVFFAHTDLSGVALFEEAQYHGIRAAESALRAMGRDVAPLI